jgi:polyisoprenoid-binding protein YceI
MIWEIDPTHSHVSFAIRVMAVSTTRGRFNALRGRIHIDEQNPANSWVDAQVEAASIDTRIFCGIPTCGPRPSLA